MITGPRKAFEARCRERGYSWDEVRECIVSEDGDLLTVDETHSAYPYPKTTSGPGTELKALLSRVGIKPKPNCACNARARLMDKNGPDWCEENISQIVGWLQEEHAKRQSIIPFIPLAAEQLVRLAIRRARKKDNGK